MRSALSLKFIPALVEGSAKVSSINIYNHGNMNRNFAHMTDDLMPSIHVLLQAIPQRLL
ncbi:MAG: nucleoside-diphosphate-sugar epimerase [Alteromonas macleodii]|jgi:nucleoside-diphosphate-sugar epimerase